MKKKTAVLMGICSLMVVLLTGCGGIKPSKKDYKVSDHVKLGKYKGLEVDVTKMEIADSDIEQGMYKDLANKDKDLVKFEESSRKVVEDGDVVDIDYTGYKDDKAFEGGSAEGYSLEIGSKSFINGFEEGLIGAEVGKKTSLNLTFPDDYDNEELAGEEVVFEVKVNSITETVYEEITDEIVKEVTDHETVDQYREEIIELLEKAREEKFKADKTNSAFKQIVEDSEIISYPPELIETYRTSMDSYYKQYAEQYQMTFEDYAYKYLAESEEDYNEKADKYAEEATAQKLVIEAIIKAEKLKLSKKEYNAKLKILMEDYGIESEEELFATLEKDDVIDSMLWEKALEFVLNKIK